MGSSHLFLREGGSGLLRLSRRILRLRRRLPVWRAGLSGQFLLFLQNHSGYSVLIVDACLVPDQGKLPGRVLRCQPLDGHFPHHCLSCPHRQHGLGVRGKSWGCR